jgi:hypothetical protein
VLQIRPEQLLEMQQPRIDEYLAKVLPKLEEDYPDPYEQAGGTDGVRKIVCNAIALGERHGLEREGDITALASLMLVFGRDLIDREENGWMRKILQSGSIANESKMTMIIEQMAANENAT